MVSDTIKQKDVYPAFIKINLWIKDGITNFAIDLTVQHWSIIHCHQNYMSFKHIRNHTLFDRPILPLNRW